MQQNQTPRAYSYSRISTKIQAKGHGIERQLEDARLFAAEHDLELDHELSLTDVGVSAFKGKNAASGNLGKILRAIEDGRIASGSWLIVESFDRLSRQDVFSAFSMISRIVDAGIIIATTSG